MANQAKCTFYLRPGWRDSGKLVSILRTHAHRKPPTSNFEALGEEPFFLDAVKRLDLNRELLEVVPEVDRRVVRLKNDDGVVQLGHDRERRRCPE